MKQYFFNFLNAEYKWIEKKKGQNRDIKTESDIVAPGTRKVNVSHICLK